MSASRQTKSTGRLFTSSAVLTVLIAVCAVALLPQRLIVVGAWAAELCTAGMSGTVTLPDRAEITDCAAGGTLTFKVANADTASSLLVSGGSGFGRMTLAMSPARAYCVTIRDASFSNGLLLTGTLPKGSEIVVQGCTISTTAYVFSHSSSAAVVNGVLVSIRQNYISGAGGYLFQMYTYATNATLLAVGNVVTSTGNLYPLDTVDSGYLFNVEFIFLNNIFRGSIVLFRPMQGSVVPSFTQPADPSLVTEEQARSIYGKCAIILQGNTVIATSNIFISESGQSMRRAFDVVVVNNIFNTTGGSFTWNAKFTQTIAYHPIKFIFIGNSVSITSKYLIGVEAAFPIVDGSAFVFKDSVLTSTATSMATPYYVVLRFTKRVGDNVLILVQNVSTTLKGTGSTSSLTQLFHMDATGYTYSTTSSNLYVNMCANVMFGTLLSMSAQVAAATNWMTTTGTIRQRSTGCASYAHPFYEESVIPRGACAMCSVGTDMCSSGMSGTVSLPNVADISDCVVGGALTFNVNNADEATGLRIKGGSGYGQITLAMSPSKPYSILISAIAMNSGGITLQGKLAKGSEILIRDSILNLSSYGFTDSSTASTNGLLMTYLNNVILIKGVTTFLYPVSSGSTLRNLTFNIIGNNIRTASGNLYPFDTVDTGRLFNVEFGFYGNSITGAHVLFRPMMGSTTPSQPNTPADPSAVSEADARSVYGKCIFILQNNNVTATSGTIYFSETSNTMHRAFDVIVTGNRFVASNDFLWTAKWAQTVAYHPAKFIFASNDADINRRIVVGVEFAHPVVGNSQIIFRDSVLRTAASSMSTPYFTYMKFSAQVSDSAALEVRNVTAVSKSGASPSALSQLLTVNLVTYTYAAGTGPYINMCGGTNALFSTVLTTGTQIANAVSWTTPASGTLRLRTSGCPTMTIVVPSQPVVSDPCGYSIPDPTPSATGTLSRSKLPPITKTGLLTRTHTVSRSVSGTVTTSASVTHTVSASASVTATQSRTKAVTLSSTRSLTATGTASSTTTPSRTKALTLSGTRSLTVSASIMSATLSPSKTHALSRSVTRSLSKTMVPTRSATKSASCSPSATGTASFSASSTHTFSTTSTGTVSFSATATLTATPSRTHVASKSATVTASLSVSATLSGTVSASPTLSMSATVTPTTSASASGTPTPTGVLTVTRTDLFTVTASQSGTAPGTGSTSLSGTATTSSTGSLTVSVTSTASPTGTLAPSFSASGTASSSVTNSRTVTASGSTSASVTVGTASGTRSQPTTRSASASLSGSVSMSPSVTVNESTSKSASYSVSRSADTLSATRSALRSESETGRLSQSDSARVSVSLTMSVSQSLTSSFSASPTLILSTSHSLPASVTSSRSPTQTKTISASYTLSATTSRSSTISRSGSASRSLSLTHSTTPSFSNTVSSSQSPSRSATATVSLSVSSSRVSSITITVSVTKSSSASASCSVSRRGNSTSITSPVTASLTPIGTRSTTASFSPSRSSTVTSSVSSSDTKSASLSPTHSASSSNSLSSSGSLSTSDSVSKTATGSVSASHSASSSSTLAPTRTPTLSPSISASDSLSASASSSSSASSSVSRTLVPTPSHSASPSLTPTSSSSSSVSGSSSQSFSTTSSLSQSASKSASESSSISPSHSASQSLSTSSSASPSTSLSPSATMSGSMGGNSTTRTLPPTPSATASVSASASSSPSVSASTSRSVSRTASSSASTSSSQTASVPLSDSVSVSPTIRSSASTTIIRTTSVSQTASRSATQTQSASPSRSKTVSGSATRSLQPSRSISRSASASGASLSASASKPTSPSGTRPPTVSASATTSSTTTNSASLSATMSSTGTVTESFSGSLAASRSTSGVLSMTASASDSASLTPSAPNASASRTIAPVFLDGRGYLARAMHEMGSNSTVLFIGDPFSLEVQLVTMALVGPCGTASDQSLGRASRYLLSPFITLGPVGYVGIIHLAATLAVIGAYAALLFGQRRRAWGPSELTGSSEVSSQSGGQQRLALPLCRELWDAVLFPSVPFAVALFLYPGALYALFSAMRGDSGSQSPLVDLVGAVCGGLQAAVVLAAALHPVVRSAAFGEFAEAPDAGAVEREGKATQSCLLRWLSVAVASGWWYSLPFGEGCPVQGSVGLLLIRGFAGGAPNTPRAVAALAFLPALLVAVACVGAALLPIEAYIDGSGNGEKYIGDTRDQVPAITSCAYRQYAAGAVLLVLALAVAALRPMLTLLANVLTAVSLAACAAVIIIGGAEAASGYGAAAASGSALWSVRLVAMGVVFAATTARTVHIIVAIVRIARNGAPSSLCRSNGGPSAAPKRSQDHDVVSADRLGSDGEVVEVGDATPSDSNGSIRKQGSSPMPSADRGDDVLVAFVDQATVRDDGDDGMIDGRRKRPAGAALFVDLDEESFGEESSSTSADAVRAAAVHQQIGGGAAYLSHRGDEGIITSDDDEVALPSIAKALGDLDINEDMPYDAVPTVVTPAMGPELVSPHLSPATIGDEITAWSSPSSDAEAEDAEGAPSPMAGDINDDDECIAMPPPRAAMGSSGSGSSFADVLPLDHLPRAAIDGVIGGHDDDDESDGSYSVPSSSHEEGVAASGPAVAMAPLSLEFHHRADGSDVDTNTDDDATPPSESEPSVAEAVGDAWGAFMAGAAAVGGGPRPAGRAFGVHGFDDDTADGSGDDIDALRMGSSDGSSDDAHEDLREECVNSEDDYY